MREAKVFFAVMLVFFGALIQHVDSMMSMLCCVCPSPNTPTGDISKKCEMHEISTSGDD